MKKLLICLFIISCLSSILASQEVTTQNTPHSAQGTDSHSEAINQLLSYFKGSDLILFSQMIFFGKPEMEELTHVSLETPKVEVVYNQEKFSEGLSKLDNGVVNLFGSNGNKIEKEFPKILWAI